MNSAGDMFGVLYGKWFGWDMAWAIRTEGDRVGGGPTLSSITQKKAYKKPLAYSCNYNKL